MLLANSRGVEQGRRVGGGDRRDTHDQTAAQRLPLNALKSPEATGVWFILHPLGVPEVVPPTGPLFRNSGDGFAACCGKPQKRISQPTRRVPGKHP